MVLGGKPRARRARRIVRRTTVLWMLAAFLVASSPASVLGLGLFSDTVRASIDTAGDEQVGPSQLPSMAWDTDRLIVVFHSEAPLVAHDSNSSADVYVRDMQSQETTRISSSITTAQPDGQSKAPVISENARYVAYESSASNLVPSDDNGSFDVFVFDMVSEETTRVSISSDGDQGDLASRAPSINSDGSLVVFESESSLVSDDTNGVTDIYLHDMSSGDTIRVSEAVGGVQVTGASRAPAISADGSTIVFESSAADLHSSDSDTLSDVFAYDVASGGIELVSVSSAEVKGTLASRLPSVSEDGDVIAFESESPNLSSGDSNAKRDIFLRDRDTGTTTLISKASDGTQSGGDSSEARLSPDGRFAVFSSAGSLAAGQTDGMTDVFVYDHSDGSIATVSRSVDGSDADGSSNSPAISPDGRFAAFHSWATNLITGDANSSSDIFVVEFGSRSIERVAGTNRFRTAVEASKRAFPSASSVESVVLATGYNWPDALGGAALAGAVDGPLLLCATNDLRDETADEIERLGASTVYILGGEAAVSSQVASQVDAVPGVTDVVRVGGKDRYETAAGIAEKVRAELGGATDGRVFVATGLNFPDALAASPASVSRTWPIILSDPRKSSVTLPGWANGAYVLGGTAVVSADVEAQLRDDLGPANVDRWSGANRYATAVDIAQNAVALGALEWDNVTVATGEQFPDALSGGVMAGHLDGAMLLTTTSALRAEPRIVLEDNQREVFTAWVMGGSVAVSQKTFSQIEDALGE